MATKIKWTEDREAQLTELVGDESPVSVATVSNAADELETTPRSISSKLRKMGFEVETATAKPKTFSEEEAQELADYVEANSGSFTYTEIAAAVCGGKFTPRQVQGKMLAMELTAHAAPTPKKEAVKTYSDSEEEQFISLANTGSSIEAIAEALDKSVPSVRGKALSLLSKGAIESIPHQENKVDKATNDPLAGVGNIADLTVSEIAETTGRTERGIKTMLTRRGITCANYDGAAKAAKAAAKREAA